MNPTIRPRRSAGSALLLVLLSLPAAADPPARIDDAPPVSTGTDPLAKLHDARAFEGLREVDLPGTVLPPRVEALSCGSPATFGTLTATNPYYDVFMAAGTGAFTARTGRAHSVTALAGSPQNVIFGGAAGGPGTSDVTWYFHDSGTAYLSPAGGAACLFDPPDTAMEPASVGIEQEWTVSPSPGITCTLREEIVAFGTTEADSGVRLTLATTNSAGSSASVNVGVRWQIDYQNTTDDGPLIAPVICEPPSVEGEWSTEHELSPAEIRDFYRIQNNQGSPIFSNVTSTTSIVGVADTGTPDRLVYGRWGSLRASAWNYVVAEGACCPDSDSAVLWYHGYRPVDADVLAPGESSRHSVVIFTSAELVDCGSFTPGCASNVTAPPRDQWICEGDSATLDGSGIALTDCAGAVDYTWSDGTSTWSGAVQTVTPSSTTAYTLAVTCSTDAACRVDYGALVTVDQTPLFLPPLAADPDECNLGIRLQWNPATWRDATGSGVYHVYRSTVSCADALLQTPLALGLTTDRYVDRRTTPGTTYYYVVEAEDATRGTTCRPQGPLNAGSVTQLCAVAVTEVLGDGEPQPLGPVLRARHAGDAVTMDWSLAPALPAGDHFHLQKAWDEASCCFRRANPEGDRSTSFTETDRSSWLQFFDVRRANACESEARPETAPPSP